MRSKQEAEVEFEVSLMQINAFVTGGGWCCFGWGEREEALVATSRASVWEECSVIQIIRRKGKTKG